jgi:serine/threonine protein kinase
MTSKTPKVFVTPMGTYTHEKQLGEGGCGRVFGVLDEAGQRFAIKLLDPNKATKEKFRRFKNEIFFGRSVMHANIAPVLDYGMVLMGGAESPFFVMPLYASTLRAAIQSHVLPETGLRYFANMLDGVETAHLKDVWHRDLKPENILIDSARQIAVVADFGIARFAPALQETAVETQPHTRLANANYAAPEQRTGGSVDQKADIFALGLILHELNYRRSAARHWLRPYQLHQARTRLFGWARVGYAQQPAAR